MRLIHTAIEVSDIEATLEFYAELGLSKSHEFTHDGVRNVYVGTGDGLEIQFKYDPERTDPVEPSGINHIALEVDDAEAAFDRIVEATGCSVVREPFDATGAGRAVFVADPDGYAVELVDGM